jgi:hypothetical protein
LVEPIRAALVVSALAVFATPARAQGTTGFLDRLQLTTLGAGVGSVRPAQIVPAMTYSLEADYGEAMPGWRVMFGLSYWESRFQDNVVRAFVDTLSRSLSDTTARVSPSPVNLYDVTFNVSLRYAPNAAGAGVIAPFADVGVAGHVLNADGKLINGTFVERSLDDVAAGVFAAVGVQVRWVQHVAIEGQARADLLSGFRSTQFRVSGVYYFGHLREATP